MSNAASRAGTLAGLAVASVLFSGCLPDPPAPPLAATTTNASPATSAAPTATTTRPATAGSTAAAKPPETTAAKAEVTTKERPPTPTVTTSSKAVLPPGTPPCPYTETLVSAIVGVALAAQQQPPGACSFTADGKDPSATAVFISLSTKAEATASQGQVCAEMRNRFGTTSPASKGSPSCTGASSVAGKALVVTSKGGYIVSLQTRTAQTSATATQTILKKLVEALPG